MNIQGIGTIFSGGRGIDALQRALHDGVGKPAFVECSGFDQPVPVRQVATETLKDKEVLKGMRRAARPTKMAVLAACDASHDAGLDAVAPERIGVIVATGLGPHVRTFKFLDGILDFGDTAVSPTDFSHSVHNAAAGYITSRLQTHGPVQTITDFDFAFQQGLALADCWLREERCDVVLLGTAEELGDVLLHVSNRLLDLPADGMPEPYGFSDNPTIVPGEGAAFFVLTREPGGEGGYGAIRAGVMTKDAEGEGADLLVLDAEGLSGSEAEYKTRLSGSPPAANYSPFFGSMMTGAAFQCAAAALAIKNRTLYATPLWETAPALPLCRATEPAEVRRIDCVKRGRNGEWRRVALTT